MTVWYIRGDKEFSIDNYVRTSNYGRQTKRNIRHSTFIFGEIIQGGSNMTGTDLCVNKPHCAAAVRP